MEPARCGSQATPEAGCLIACGIGEIAYDSGFQRFCSGAKIDMTAKTRSMAGLSVLALLAGCATQQGASTTATSAATAGQPSTPGARVVKSRDGRFEGEIVGTPAPGSRFAKLQIGMTMGEVSGLIGAPDDMVRHETGKRWIPFYYGNDAQRLQVLYRGEGCLTYTGGNVFGGGGSELIRITVQPQGGCME